MMITKRYCVMSVPGDENTPTSWYAFDRQAMRAVGTFGSHWECRAAVRKLNGN